MLVKGAVLFFKDTDRDYNRNRNAHTLYFNKCSFILLSVSSETSFKGSRCYRNTKMYIWKSNQFVWMQLFLVLLQVVPLLYHC